MIGRLLASLALALALGAGAGAPSIALPPWPLAPDGELVAVTGGAALAAEGASVEPVGGGLWRVVPAPGARSVKLSAGGAHATAAVEPPPGRVVIRATPARPVKGRDKEAALAIEVLGADGRPDPAATPPFIAAGAGSVVDLEPAGAGRFTARYLLPGARYPELAVLTAVSPRCPLCATPRALGTAVIPLASAIDLPGRTERDVQMSVQIAGETFGPVRSDSEGRFRVPVVVPPGAFFGAGMSLDHAGNRKLSRIDLHLPPIDQLTCATWPVALPADGRATARVWCVATDATGKPAPRAQLQLEAKRGRVTPLAPLGDGVFGATYTAPRGGGGRSDALVARYPGGGPPSNQEMTIALATGAPFELGYALPEEPVAVGASVPARVWARDERGDPLAAPHGPAGAREGFVGAPPGLRFVARAELGDWVQPAPLSLELPPAAEPATLSLRREGGAWVASARSVDARPAAGAALAFGDGARATTDAQGEARVPAGGDVETVQARNGARACGFAGFGPPPEPTSLARTFPIPLQPASPVDVRVRRENGFVRWRVEDGKGRALPGREVKVLAAGGARVGPAQREPEGGRASASGRGTVTVVDVASGVAASVEVE